MKKDRTAKDRPRQANGAKNAPPAEPAPAPDRKPAPVDLMDFLCNTQDGMFVVDSSQRIVMWNKGAQEILGYAADEVLGKYCYEVIVGDWARKGDICVQDCNVLLLAVGGFVPPSTRRAVLTKDGSQKWIEVTHIAVPLSGAAKERETALVHVFRDATRAINAQAIVDDLVRYIQVSASPEQRAVIPYHGLAKDSPRETPLTQREIEVLRLMAEGYGTNAIADRLVISASTARNHVQNILDRLGVHSRMDAVMYGIRHRLIPGPKAPGA